MDKKKLENILGESVSNFQPLSGGCIANTQKLTTLSGRNFVIKRSEHENDMFEKEANGLKELKKANVIYVPEVFYADKQCLITEFVEQGKSDQYFFETFGKLMAELHRYTSKHFGFYEDNYIGATPQPNIASGEEATNWIDFYFNKRLYFQFKLAENNGYADNEFRRLFNNIEKKLPDILKDSDEVPSLLHGDLWSGNYLIGEKGQAVIFDPAVYYGHREAELAMTRLFGGFSNEFYRAYNNEWPLKPGYQYREGVYTLYHVLNHLNLFGRGYFHQCIALMKQYNN